MSKAARRTFAVSLTAIFTGLSLAAMAQQPPPPNPHSPPPKKPAVQGQQHPPGPPGPGPRVGGGPGGAAQFRGGGPPGQFHGAHALGERGYSFRGEHGRRDIGSFNERERAVWLGGRWRHEQHFGRYGYWWEVNGVWYFYDQPMAGPPSYVSEMEFMDDDPNTPVMVGQPAPVMVVPPPVVYVRPPPPPVVCIGPLCVR
jgi:hypothetical protein